PPTTTRSRSPRGPRKDAATDRRVRGRALLVVAQALGSAPLAIDPRRTAGGRVTQLGDRSRMTPEELTSGAVELGERGYDELRAFADLRGGHEYLSARYSQGDLEEVWVHGLAIAHQRQKDGTPGGFLLVELDADAGLIDDWVELDLEE